MPEQEVLYGGVRGQSVQPGAELHTAAKTENLIKRHQVCRHAKWWRCRRQYVLSPLALCALFEQLISKYKACSMHTPAVGSSYVLGFFGVTANA